MPAPGLRFASLGSGSRGNATLIECGRTCVVLDCGFPLRETLARLARLGREPASISAILVTHEHGDHLGGVGPLARRLGVPVWMTPGTWRAAQATVGRLPALQLFNCHQAFAVGDLEVQPFPVPHDAHEPSQFVFSDGRRRLGVLTDVGESTPHLEQCLSGCDGLLLECNHDRALLRDGPYPDFLKARVGGRLGHLANDTAAAILSRLDSSHLQCLVAAHLSEKNNTPGLAQAALAGALGCDTEFVQIADQDEGLGWQVLG